MLINVKNANNGWYFNIYEHDKLHAELSVKIIRISWPGRYADNILAFVCVALSVF